MSVFPIMGEDASSFLNTNDMKNNSCSNKTRCHKRRINKCTKRKSQGSSLNMSPCISMSVQWLDVYFIVVFRCFGLVKSIVWFIDCIHFVFMFLLLDFNCLIVFMSEALSETLERRFLAWLVVLYILESFKQLFYIGKLTKHIVFCDSLIFL